jgi:hypothetical protein
MRREEVKRFIPLRVNIGPKRLSDRMSDDYMLAVLDVREQFKRVLRNFEAWIVHMEGETVKILKEALRPTFDRSQIFVPRKTGALKESGYLEVRTFRGKVVAEMGYGRGGQPKYAIIQHENLEYYHDPPAQAKFLERPLLEDADEIRRRCIALYKEASGV